MAGRTVAQDAVARGHDVTCLARGNGEAAPGATFVAADRDREDGLEAVAGAAWDTVLDVARHPGHVRRAVRDLRARHWVFVSSGNAYASFSSLEQDEDAPLRGPLAGDVMTSMEVYGEAKVACEDAVREARGDGDHRPIRSHRWPRRLVGAHRLLALAVRPPGRGPGRRARQTSTSPAPSSTSATSRAWLVSAAEERLDGTFNATGPTTTLADVLTAAAQVAGSTATPLGCRPSLLAELGVTSWMGPSSLPLWIDDPQWRGFATLGTARARAAGLRVRPLRDTLRDALAFEEVRDVPRAAGLTDDEERRVQEAVLR